MNILVTGANGQLGNELRNLAVESRHRFIFTDVNEVPGLETTHLDITDREAVRIVADSEKVDVIVNCAAYTNVDGAEDNKDIARLLNCEAVENLAKVAAGRKAVLIHVSTDYVFPGTACRPLKESDEPSPKSVYGSTKLAGEQAVKNSGCKAVIIRTAWLYSIYGKNFVKTMLKLFESNPEVKVVCDQVGTPTYAGDLAEFILHIIDNGLEKTGTYHFSDEGAISWYDFSCAIKEISGSGVKVIPCSSGQFPAKADRPHYSVLDKSLAKETFGVEIPYWRDSLVKCIKLLK